MTDATRQKGPGSDDASTAGRAPRHAVISGAAGGLGSVLAATFEDHGCRLVLPARSGLDELRAAHPGARVVEADLTDPGDCRRVAADAREAFGIIDAVLNVAGGFATTSALELSAADLEKQLDLNLRTAVQLTSAFLPAMVEQGAGNVMAVSAGAARGGNGLGAYAASKAALEGYMRSVRAEVEPHGVAVSLLIPEGTIDTDANRRAMPDADRSAWIAPVALAEAAWFLATRRAGGHVGELRVSA
ncbi:MAG: SDR family oxidoreductase [Trueperaceae bacterium]|nr:SDR family oxidoreductase [Trueperaceae bacterium]